MNDKQLVKTTSTRRSIRWPIVFAMIGVWLTLMPAPLMTNALELSDQSGQIEQGEQPISSQDDPADFFLYLPLVKQSPSGWSNLTSGVTNLLHGVGCTASGQHCMAVGEGIALWTVDGGQSWQPVTPGIAGLVLYDVSCPTETRCVVVGQSNSSTGVILVTNNGGTSWSPANQDYWMRSVDCISAEECVAVGNDSEARFTYNGGANWSNGRLGNTPLYGVDCISSRTCWMVGVGGRVIGTYPNAGGPGGIGVVSKKDLLFDEAKTLMSVSCIDASRCVTVGEIGKIFRTTNTGGSWNEQSSGTGVTLQGVSCPTADLCYAVGDGGTILVSGNGGSAWGDDASSDASPVSANLKAIDCFGPTNCLAVGANGTILLRQ